MGASGWDYIEQYRGNLQSTLDALHERLLAEGVGLRWWPPDEPRPTTLAEFYAAVEGTDEDGEFWATGTHSILDVARIGVTGGRVGDGGIRPLSEDDTVRVFGGSRPTVADWHRIGPDRDEGDYERWEGRCVLLYDLSGSPVDVGFWGCSGD